MKVAAAVVLCSSSWSSCFVRRLGEGILARVAAALALSFSRP